MKIINETTYNTDDILHLWRRAVEAIQKRRRESGVRQLRDEDLGPETLRVGYYGPKYSEGTPVSEMSFAKMSSRWVSRSQRRARLGIIKPAKLPLSPLQHLATTASDELVLPLPVVEDIADAIVSFIDYYGGTSAEEWPWLRDIKIRYLLRAKRGSLVGAKREAQRLRLTQTQAKLALAEKRRQELLQAERDVAAEIDSLRGRIAKLEGALRGRKHP